MSHFRATRDGIEVSLSADERTFLGDVLPLLADLGEIGVDPAATRLNVPVYLDDPDANQEWWRLMAGDLDSGRQADRAIYSRVMEDQGAPVLSDEEADSFLRVVNEARLVLGARLGLDVAEDHDRLPDQSRRVLDYLGWILEELTVELSKAL